MQPVGSPSCARAFRHGSFLRTCIGWPGLGRIPELVIAAEFQKRISIGRKFRWRFAEFRNDARIIENGIPVEIWPEHFEQRSPVAPGAAAIRDPIDRAGERS